MCYLYSNKQSYLIDPNKIWFIQPLNNVMKNVLYSINIFLLKYDKIYNIKIHHWTLSEREKKLFSIFMQIWKSDNLEISVTRDLQWISE